jgi:hypothetical protein
MALSIAEAKKAAQAKGTPAKKAPAKKAPAKKAPGKAVAVKKDTGDFTKARATSHTAKIKASHENTVKLITEAYNGRIWLALGYNSWDKYREGEFGDAPLRLNPVDRKAAVVKMIEEANMSSRAIATMTGTSQMTAARDAAEARDQLKQNGSVPSPAERSDAGEDGAVIDAEVVDDPNATTEPEPEGGKVIGLDGKTRSAEGSKTPTVINIVSVARSIATDLEKVRVRLGALYDRDDYEENSVQVDKVLQQAIDDFAAEVGDRLPELEPAE